MFPLLDGILDALNMKFLTLKDGKIYEVNLDCLRPYRAGIAGGLILQSIAFTRTFTGLESVIEIEQEPLVIKAVRELNLMVKEKTVRYMIRKDREAYRRLPDELAGKEVAVLFSGGKDSVAAYWVLKEILEEGNVVAVHSYIKMFEDLLEEDSEAALQFAKAKVIVADVPDVPKLPTREDRWCTEIKMGVIERAIRGKIVVEGERIFESRGRFKSYIGKPIINLPRVYPIKYLTNADTFIIANELGVLSNVYTYSTRASCTLCPFANRLENWLRLEEARRRGSPSYEYFTSMVERTFGSTDKMRDMDFYGEKYELDKRCYEEGKVLSFEEVKERFLKFLKEVVSLKPWESAFEAEKAFEKIGLETEELPKFDIIL